MITTGPGLIRPIATASVSWRSVNQWWSVTRPWCRKGTTASPEPNVSALALAKNRPRVPTEPPAPRAPSARRALARSRRFPPRQQRALAVLVEAVEERPREREQLFVLT